MNKTRKIRNIILLAFFIGLSSASCNAQFFWLGFQAGEGVSWFSNPGQGSSRLSAGSGTSFAIFMRYGTRPYYQLAFEWLFSTNQMKFEMAPGSASHDNIPFHSFKVPFTAGYEIIHKPAFKWRTGGGIFIGTARILSSNSLEISSEDIRNPQFGLIGETGVQYLNFLVLFDYNYSLSKFFTKSAGNAHYNPNTHLQVFALKIGMQF